MTESYSGSSISRASCLVGFNDDETDFSSVNESEANNWVSLHENKQVLSNPTGLKNGNNPKEQLRKMKSEEVKFLGKESRYEYDSTILSTAGAKSATGVDESSIECDICCRVMPCDDDEVNWTDISQDARNLEAYELEDDSAAKFSAMEKSVVKGLSMERVETRARGFSDVLQENTVMIYNSLLLGLGFKRLGFHHDFFQALIN